MQIGMIGLGRMGIDMSRRLLNGGHAVVAYNRTQDKVRVLEREGAVGAATLEALVRELQPPRCVWIMVPAGAVTDEHIAGLARLLSPGDLVIDGANSFYKDDLRRSKELGERGIAYMDVGVSGGIWGLKLGYCLMAGGAEADFKVLEPILKSLAAEGGYLHCGKTGAGHFVKMVHNGIEYGMMQVYAEGFEIIKGSPYNQDYAKLSHLWNQGSVIRSWLLELAEQAFADDPGLEKAKGYVEDSGEGRWTVQQAVDSGVAAPVITASLYARFKSRQKDAFGDRLLASLRNRFGGHAVRTRTPNKNLAEDR